MILIIFLIIARNQLLEGQNLLSTPRSVMYLRWRLILAVLSFDMHSHILVLFTSIKSQIMTEIAQKYVYNITKNDRNHYRDPFANCDLDRERRSEFLQGSGLGSRSFF